MIKQKKLFVLRGDPGIGKSTLADALAREYDAAVVDKDDLKDLLYPEYVDDFERTDEVGYKFCIAFTRRNLKNGVSVVFDDILNREWVYRALREVSESTGSALFILDCVLDSNESWSSRLAKRSAECHASHRLADLDAALKWRSKRRGQFPLDESLVIRVDLSISTRESVSRLLEFLKQWE